MSPADPVLKAVDVAVRRGGQQILADLSLSIPSGSRTLVRGPSGAGKSTLFAVLGLLEPPDSGRVVVDGTDASELPERRRARLRRDAIGFVFQDFQLVPDLTARENALLPQSHGGDRDEDWIDELFDVLGVVDRADRYPATLSGGEKQRVAIARALANRPDVVLADEPTGQLDPETTDRVAELLVDVQTSADTALVTISHDPSLEGLFDRTATLRDGHLIETTDTS
ncbi:ABC transporter ATP-binding protein [Natronococcus occultus]|uniref:ABC-type antimicrobial peptide transport system, ATPase component n=1 Tax=Natronococcus occultus SP4 TaxID=694430 RepID=L0K3F5_9EURY|nr:ABC transporter ATP-binding protein [Natronococcus occultus]AGB38648.1 ABC-type antimicrobial peptide transport system, ATPase component [Natronococcus occultus SP4]